MVSVGVQRVVVYVILTTIFLFVMAPMFAETSRACQIYHNVFTQLQLIRKLYGSFLLADFGLWHWKFYMFLVIEEDWESEHIGASCLLGPLIRSFCFFD